MLHHCSERAYNLHELKKNCSYEKLYKNVKLVYHSSKNRDFEFESFPQKLYFLETNILFCYLLAL